MRAGTAGMVAALVFRDLKKETQMPGFTTPDPAVVTQTDDAHPATQCRLDTYFAAAVCFHDLSIAPSDTDVTVGACSQKGGQQQGLRPSCWFAPN